MRAVFRQGVPLAEVAPARQGLATADNDRFVRAWHEVDFGTIGFGCSSLEEAASSNRKWFPYNKGGDFRKWYGNQEFVLNWQDNGQEVRTFKNAAGKIRSAVRNDTFYFQQSISWSDITSAATAFRDYPTGFIYDVTGMSAFAPSRDVKLKVLGFCNSKVASGLTRALNPTLHFQIGNYQSLPFISDEGVEGSCSSVAECVSLAKADWDCFETSWEFSTFPLLKPSLMESNVELSFRTWAALCASNIAQMILLEQDINRRFIDAYGLRSELDDSVPENEITLARADPTDDMKRLLSYSVGCMMGRFSLEREGIVFAGGEDPLVAEEYGAFAPDEDGIIPMLDRDWFADDVANRVVEFIKEAWHPETVAENLRFIATTLGVRAEETPVDTIRRYLSRDFFKDHLQTYKNRPIYWLFSSGREKAFECLVYLHRYNAGTLSRMRMEYVVPLQGRMRGKGEQLQAAIDSAPNAASKTKFRKELEVIKKKQAELVKFDEELRHFADQRIEINLDVGVKKNYAKFGNLLAEVKKVAGDTDE
jgi:hypothetical protein